MSRPRLPLLLTLAARPDIPLPSDLTVRWPEGGSWHLTRKERDAWTEQCKALFSFGFSHPRDAQNNAALGCMEAIYAVQMYELFLIAEELKE